ncbi:hypothetical protein VTL71DRAFT_491 [Oculimacula yallundae]|uniref:Uncharacterized protein n=1 Tax=Oculimacula yallundae TaxID=86028 RepID=A0ABR4D1Q2_9HELO
MMPTLISDHMGVPSYCTMMALSPDRFEAPRPDMRSVTMSDSQSRFRSTVKHHQARSGQVSSRSGQSPAQQPGLSPTPSPSPSVEGSIRKPFLSQRCAIVRSVPVGPVKLVNEPILLLHFKHQSTRKFCLARHFVASAARNNLIYLFILHGNPVPVFPTVVYIYFNFFCARTALGCCIVLSFPWRARLPYRLLSAGLYLLQYGGLSGVRPLHTHNYFFHTKPCPALPCPVLPCLALLLPIKFLSGLSASFPAIKCHCQKQKESEDGGFFHDGQQQRIVVLTHPVRPILPILVCQTCLSSLSLPVKTKLWPTSLPARDLLYLGSQSGSDDLGHNPKC